MLRCLQIAKNALGTAAPNPSVGCVIVHNNKIIGEGFTSKHGGPHAEVMAINSVKNEKLLQDATLYVSLEPCSHYGKTPPCSKKIIEKGIPNVVIGCIDDNTLVAGKGVKMLREHKVNVILNILERECKLHLKRFFTYHNLKRPFIILKWAETKNGFIAPINKFKRAPIWISNQYSRQLTHKWRSEEQSILVGVQTVNDDNPSLTTRKWKGKNPVRIVLDGNSRARKDSTIFDNNAKTIHVTEDLIKKGYFLSNLMSHLYNENITSVIVEGGKRTLDYFIELDLWDEARVFSGDLIIEEGIKAPLLTGTATFRKKILDDTLTIYEKN